jgi:predicted nucleic acid-binding protein
VESLARSSHILPVDSVCFREWARLMEGKQGHLLEDAMIAAIARIHGMIVATRNERDFSQFEVRALNPFRVEGATVSDR